MKNCLGAFRRKRVREMTSRRKMMMIRSAVLVCGLSVTGAAAAVAQDQAPAPPPPGQQGPPPGGRGMMMDPGRRAEHMKHELNLTDDQTSQVKGILEDSRSKMEALRSNTALSREDRRSQMMSIHKAENDKIEALLTPDQKTKYETMQQEMREHRRGEAPNGEGPPPPPPSSPQS